MYLTETEFLVLSGIKIDMSKQEMIKKLKLTHTQVFCTLNNLCKKYDKNHYTELKYVDLKKVEIFDQSDIPYYQYEKTNEKFEVYDLVDKIIVSKKDIQKMAEQVSNAPDDEDYELICYEDYNRGNKNLSIRNTTTGKNVRISTIICGSEREERYTNDKNN